jgi:hypothetical protein
MLTFAMAGDEVLTALLTQLDGLARAPMTGPERELRAKSLLKVGVEPSDLARATASVELTWNQRKAAEYGVPAATWLQAVHVADLPASASFAELLDRLHRAEAVVNMLKAGYIAGRDPLGRMTWFGRG